MLRPISVTQQHWTLPSSHKACQKRFPGLLVLLFRWVARSARLFHLQLHLHLRRIVAALTGYLVGVWGLRPELVVAVRQCCSSVLRLCTCGGGERLAPSTQNTALTASQSRRLCARLSCESHALWRPRRWNCLCVTPKGKRWYVHTTSFLFSPLLPCPCPW